MITSQNIPYYQFVKKKKSRNVKNVLEKWEDVLLLFFKENVRDIYFFTFFFIYIFDMVVIISKWKNDVSGGSRWKSKLN